MGLGKGQNRHRLCILQCAVERPLLTRGEESVLPIDDTACILTGLGKGALIAKTDIAHAYRYVPVHRYGSQVRAWYAVEGQSAW